MPNFIKYLTDVRTYFTIKIELRKIKLLDQLFFLRASLDQFKYLEGPTPYFYRLNFENIKIIIYIILKNSKIWGGHAFNTAPPLIFGLGFGDKDQMVWGWGKAS